MASKKQARNTYNEVLELLSLLSGASVGNAGVLTLLHSVEAFGTGLKTAQQTHAALATVQLSALTDCLISLRRGQPVAAAATAGYVAGANALPPGAPVVT